MRRQRFIYSLPSQDDSSVLDPDNMSILSSHYSYPETIWSQVISPEPENLIPYYFYPYPFFPISAEPVPFIPSSSDTTLIPDTFGACGDFFPSNDGLTMSIINANSFLSSPYPDENITPIMENLPPIMETFPPIMETFPTIMDTLPPIMESLPPTIDVCLNESNIIQCKQLQAFPKVNDYGAVSILLRHLIRVDISPARAVYLTNSPASCIAAVNGLGDTIAVIHPNGRVHHIGQDVHMVTLNRQAKICRRGVIFTSSAHCLTYIVDDSGTKTTSEKLRHLNHDFSLRVFYSSGMGEKNLEECRKLVNETKYKSYKNGDEVWMIGAFRIKQSETGNVTITRNGERYAIRTSPTTGEVSIKTFSADIDIGRYADKYFSVRKGDKQVIASAKSFNVQSGSQKAGFNNYGKVVLY